MNPMIWAVWKLCNHTKTPLSMPFLSFRIFASSFQSHSVNSIRSVWAAQADQPRTLVTCCSGHWFYQSKFFPYHGCFGWDWKGYSCQTTCMNQGYCHTSWLLHFEANPPSRPNWLVSVLFSCLVPRLLKTLRNTFMLQHPAARSARPRLLQAEIDKEMWRWEFV